MTGGLDTELSTSELRPLRVTKHGYTVCVIYADDTDVAALLAQAQQLGARLRDCHVEADIGDGRRTTLIVPRDDSHGTVHRAMGYVRKHLPPLYWAEGRVDAEVYRRNHVNLGTLYTMVVEPHDTERDPQLDDGHCQLFAAFEGIARARLHKIPLHNHRHRIALQFTMDPGHDLPSIRGAAASIGVTLLTDSISVEDPEAAADLFDVIRNDPASVFSRKAASRVAD